MRRKLFGLLGFGTGLFAGSVLYRRSFGRRRERVDVYFDDGSMVSFAEGSPEAEKLLAVARTALRGVASQIGHTPEGGDMDNRSSSMSAPPGVTRS